MSGSFVRGGSGGHGGGTTTVTVSPPCYYFSLDKTGKEYYDYVKSGQAEKDWFFTGGRDGKPFVPYPGWQAHKDDTTGSFYGGVCDSGNYDGNLDGFFAFAEAWFKTHKSVYVAAGATPPNPPVPPELLVQAATKAMTLPLPTFDHNPKAGTDAFTLVNLPTWFWLDNPTTTGQVTASIPGSRATVTATLASAAFSSPRAGAVSCAGTGVHWSPGATSDCTLTFPHQTPGETVTAETSWALHWVYVGQLGNRQGDLAAIGSQDTGTVPVREVQAIDTKVG
ncbi:MAG: hypothetical protein ABI243_13620 [Lapillicoccus sp.]